MKQYLLSIAPAAQVALTLRLLGGLTTGEIARAFLVAEPTMAQRLVRAKGKIRDARISARKPFACDGSSPSSSRMNRRSWVCSRSCCSSSRVERPASHPMVPSSCWPISRAIDGISRAAYDAAIARSDNAAERDFLRRSRQAIER